MAAIVLFAGALAYYVGSVPPERPAEAASSPAAQRPGSTAPIAALIEALPFPALYIDADERVRVANPPAARLFRTARINGERHALMGQALRLIALKRHQARRLHAHGFKALRAAEVWKVDDEAGADHLRAGVP